MRPETRLIGCALMYKERAKLICTKFEHEVRCIVLRHRRQNGALEADVAEEGNDGSLALDVGNSSFLISRRVLYGECTVELVVRPSLTCAIVVYFLLSFWSLMFSWRLHSLLVLYEFSVDRTPR